MDMQVKGPEMMRCWVGMALGRERNKWWKLRKEECVELRKELTQALGGRGELPGDWESTAEVKLSRCLQYHLNRGMKTTQSAGDYSKEGVGNEKVKKVKKKLNTEYCKARCMAKAKEKVYSEAGH